MKRKEVHVLPRANYKFQVLGVKRAPLRDFYHVLLRRSWWVTLAVISSCFVLVNLIFALGYFWGGGIAHAEPGSFLSAFFFSVQTMGTIGYGAMYPETLFANGLVVVEAIFSLTLTALLTGLVFAKFSRSTARMVFSREAVVSPVNGVLTLMIRVGNERGNSIVDTQFRVALVRTETLAEGGTFFRSVDLKLVRERAHSLSRSWTVMHTVDEKSPLFGMTPELALEQEAELHMMVVGLDDITMHQVHASHRYYGHEILWGVRHVDILSEPEEGTIVVDLTKFHDTEAVKINAESLLP